MRALQIEFDSAWRGCRRGEKGGEEKSSENGGGDECVRSGGKERNGVAWKKKWSWMEVNSVKGWRVLAGISKKATHGRRRRALEMHGVHQVLTIERERERETEPFRDCPR